MIEFYQQLFRILGEHIDGSSSHMIHVVSVLAAPVPRARHSAGDLVRAYGLSASLKLAHFPWDRIVTRLLSAYLTVSFRRSRYLHSS